MSACRHRLDRLLAKQLGISRDDVRGLLAAGRVHVDGVIATERDLPVDAFSSISLDQRVLQAREPVYLMLHKPCGVLSATVDPQHPVAIDLIGHPAAADLHIAGRLDLHSSGLLLLTNDSRWSRRLGAPENGVRKQYEVTLQHPLDAAYIVAFAAGMHFPYEDITTRPARLEFLGTRAARVTLQEGRYHQIKRMFGRFRNPVLSIHRTRIGALRLDPALPPGAWRELTPDEVAAACESVSESGADNKVP